ncbi:MAG: hypothetical protein KVP17_002945 [Porospora cf. gigantea B]|uniref:uncharacterized protein n=2 Tax=Porospora cf. gigantea B TaxID=2853592 RepID=UPI0035717B34|nr:MAG: hypothetical protein KVP17_002945 [Porospora cf. gigantea B]
MRTSLYRLARCRLAAVGSYGQKSSATDSGCHELQNEIKSDLQLRVHEMHPQKNQLFLLMSLRKRSKDDNKKSRRCVSCGEFRPLDTMSDDLICSQCENISETRKGSRRQPPIARSNTDIAATIQKNLTVNPEHPDERYFCLACDLDVGSIQCDSCTKWFHMRCVGLTQAKADKMEHWLCPLCQLPEPPRKIPRTENFIDERGPSLLPEDLLLHSAGLVEDQNDLLPSL